MDDYRSLLLEVMEQLVDNSAQYKFKADICAEEIAEALDRGEEVGAKDLGSYAMNKALYEYTANLGHFVNTNLAALDVTQETDKGDAVEAAQELMDTLVDIHKTCVAIKLTKVFQDIDSDNTAGIDFEIRYRIQMLIDALEDEIKSFEEKYPYLSV